MPRISHRLLRSFLLMLITLGAGAMGFILLFLLFERPKVPTKVEYGVTFSRPYARDEFKLDPDEVLSAALDDLKIRRFRLPAYWSELEPTRGEWRFEELDRDVAAIQKRGGKIILAIGEKLPRWPECWNPSWWKALDRKEQRQETRRYLETLVKRYRHNPAIVGWQVENEPLFLFGDCPFPELGFHDQEIAWVKNLDATRPITSTDSGELSLWMGMSGDLDALGVSVYRVVSHRLFGVIRYWFIRPEMYARKALLLQPFGIKATYVSEFQMEPWGIKPLRDMTLEEQFKTLSFEQFTNNLKDAARLKMSPVDLWGVEWWYWMKGVKNDTRFWDAAREFYSQALTRP